MTASKGDTPTHYDVLGIPTRWDLRRAMGVCLAVGCGSAALGLVPADGGPWAHDCPCCLAHCVCNGPPTALQRRLRAERKLLDQGPTVGA